MLPGDTQSNEELTRSRPWAKLLFVVIFTGAIWMVLLLKLGVSAATKRPADGVLPNTFNGWMAYPVARSHFLAQYDGTEFSKRKAYTTYTLPFLLSTYLLVEPFHVIFKLPYNTAQNFIPYFYVICLSLLLVFVTRDHLFGLLEKKSVFHWLLAFLSIGIVVTDPLPWVTMLVYTRDCFHVLSIAAFCYLSTWVFNDRVPKIPLLAVGVFLALWSPIYIPAWILVGIFFNRTLLIQRRWILEVIGVCVLGFVSMELPSLMSRHAGFVPVASGFPFRSGLDGSTRYFTSIYQAVTAPIEPRHWSVLFYVVLTVVLAIILDYLRRESHHLQQTVFMIIPYATIAVIFPQFTSIHPYFTDLLLVIPATFLVAYWFLQKEFWERLTGRSYVAWILATSLILMTNLLTVSQNLASFFAREIQ